MFKVVIVGAGFGGIGCINGIVERCGGFLLPNDMSIIVLEPKENVTIGACLQYVWTGRMEKKDVSWPRSDLKAANLSQIDFRSGDAGTVTSIEMDQKTLLCKDGSTITWDSLVLAPGIVSDPSLVPGLEGAIDVCAWEQVDRATAELKHLVEAIQKAPEKEWRVMVSVARVPYKCPPLPLEVVSLIDNVLREAGVRDSAKVALSVPVDFPFGGPPAKKKFMATLETMGIEFWNFHTIQSVQKASPETTANNDLTSSSNVTFSVGGAGGGANEEKKEVTVDALFCTMPQRAPDFVVQAGLTNKLGLVPVNLQTNRLERDESTDTGDVFVIGDTCHTMFPAVQKPHPKAGAFAYSMGGHVAKQIVAKFSDQPNPSPPTRQGQCAAEVGLRGEGIVVEPNFDDCLSDPENGKPKFSLTDVENASGKKAEWIQGYLDKFFGEFMFKLPKCD